LILFCSFYFFLFSRKAQRADAHFNKISISKYKRTKKKTQKYIKKKEKQKEKKRES
jgi:hypothetical protein